jgi:cytidyltransferase-like protein
MINSVIICTGGFDPLHSGHIEYLKAAKALGNILIVGINSDAWLERKKGRAFMPFKERQAIITNLKFVDFAIAFDDTDDTAIDIIEETKLTYPNSKIIFANGGDRTAKNIPEMSVKDVEFVFGVGGKNKKNSSSWILEDYKAPKTEREWGYYRVLHEVDGTKVKELTINSGCRLTMQKHYDRSEHWHVAEGKCTIEIESEDLEKILFQELEKHDQFTIGAEDWHQLSNPYDNPCKIVEIQYGIACDEDDIERR